MKSKLIEKALLIFISRRITKLKGGNRGKKKWVTIDKKDSAWWAKWTAKDMG